MTRTTVVNVTIHDCDAYIGRPNRDYGDGYFGNPAIKALNARSTTLARVKALRGYLHYFRHRMGLVWNNYWAAQKVTSNDDEFKARVNGLRGKKLGCFCKPALCHGDIIAAWLDGGPVGLAKIEQQIRELEAQVLG